MRGLASGLVVNETNMRPVSSRKSHIGFHFARVNSRAIWTGLKPRPETNSIAPCESRLVSSLKFESQTRPRRDRHEAVSGHKPRDYRGLVGMGHGFGPV